jgi:hydrogenase-4 component E
MSLASAVQAAPGVYVGTANVIAAAMLLIEFGMLRQALARDQIRLYAAQSALLSVLAVVIAADRNLPRSRLCRLTRATAPPKPPGNTC